MYQSFYGLSDDPFRMSPSAGDCYVHRTFAKASSYIVYTLHRGEGILLITGDPGLGKTTLVRNCVLEEGLDGVTFAEVSGGHLSADDFLYVTANRFGLECDGLSTGRILTKLEQKLVSLQQQGRRGVLLVDEAQDLDIASMNEVKSLSNLEFHGRPLLQIFLVGQSSLLQYLRQPELAPVFQRVTAACRIKPMTLEEVGEYIKHRLSSCGWKGDPSIEDSVMDVIFQHSGGNPRRINLICSRLLLRGMIKDSHDLTQLDVKMVLDELYREGLDIDQGQNQNVSALKEAYR